MVLTIRRAVADGQRHQGILQHGRWHNLRRPKKQHKGHQRQRRNGDRKPREIFLAEADKLDIESGQAQGAKNQLGGCNDGAQGIEVVQSEDVHNN